MSTRLVSVRDGTLEVTDEGSGDPVVLIQTALTVGEVRLLAEAPALAAFRKIGYLRRGYGRSGPLRVPGTIPGDAADCLALLDALDLQSAAVVGSSYASAVAMQLAAIAPERVRSLVLVEPPPVPTPSGPEFRRACENLLRVREEDGPLAALGEFFAQTEGLGWQDTIDELIPGGPGQQERHALTFFDADVPALLDWTYTRADAARVRCPVLHVGGTESGPWFADSRDLVLAWFPGAVGITVEGAGHDVTTSHTAAVARAIAEFLRSPRGRGGRARGALT